MNIVRRALSGFGLLAVLLAVTFLTALSASAQVLDQVPSDALLVFKINHLQQTSAKLAELMQALGVTDFAPAMADPLAAAQQQTGMANGIDKAGDAAIVLLNGPFPTTGGGEPPMLVLIPVTDYKAFLANFTVTSTDGDVSTFTFKNETKPSYCTNWGSFAVISPLKDALGKKPEGLKVAGLAANEMTEKDVILYVNSSSLRDLLIPKLDANREKMASSLDRMFAASGQDAAQVATVKIMFNEAIDAFRLYLQDSQATTVGWTISKEGINSTLLAEFTADSTLGKLAQKVKTTDKPLLAGLPAGKYLFYGGFVHSPEASDQIIDALLAPFSKKLADAGDDGKTALDALDALRTGMKSVERGNFGVVAPTGPLGQSPLIQMVGIYKGDSALLKTGQAKWVKAQDAFRKALAGGGASEMVKTTFTENVKTVDGVSFDQMQTQMNMQGNTPGAAQAAMMMNMMYGPGGMTLLDGAVDPKTMLWISAGNDQLLTDAIASAKADTDALDEADTLKAVDAHLPKTRAVAVYIPLDVIVSTAVGYARQFGMPIPVQIPANLPPIGVSAGAQGSALRFDSHVPTPLVQSLIQAGMQFYLQHGGGGGPQGGGGGAGGL